MGTVGECCGQESGSSSCQVLNLPLTQGTNSISLSTFCCPSPSGAAVGRSGPSPWPLAPFPLASQNICSFSMSWVGKPLWAKTHLGESPSWHLDLVHTTAQRQGEQRTERHLCSQQQHSQGSGDSVRFCRSAQLIRCFPEVHLASSQSSLLPSLPCSDSYCANGSCAKTSVPPCTQGLNMLVVCVFPGGRKVKSLLF